MYKFPLTLFDFRFWCVSKEWRSYFEKNRETTVVRIYIEPQKEVSGHYGAIVP